MDDVDVAAALYVHLGRLVRVLRQESGGLTIGPGGMSALVTLSRHDDGLRLGELAELEGVRAPTLTKIVAHLEDAGHVRRDPDPDDGRAQRVSLTEAGRDFISEGRDARLGVLRHRLAVLPAGERALLEAALPALEQLVAPLPAAGQDRAGTSPRATT